MVHMDMHMDIHVQKQYCTVPVCTLRRGSWRDANKYQLHSPILPCMLVCCDITMGNGSNTDDGGRTLVSRRPRTSNSVLSAGKYFVSKTAANWLAPTNGLLRASVRVFQLGLSPVVNHALSISRSWTSGVLNSVRMLFSLPVLTFSLSPRLYHCAAASRTPSSTQPRSSELSVFPEWSEMGLCDSILYKNMFSLTPRLLPLTCNL